MAENLSEEMRLLRQNGQETKALAIMLVLSLVVHLCFFGALVFAKEFWPEKKPPADFPVIGVEFVQSSDFSDFSSDPISESDLIKELPPEPEPEAAVAPPEPEAPDVVIPDPEKTENEPKAKEEPEKPKEPEETVPEAVKPKKIPHKVSKKSLTKKKNIKTVDPDRIDLRRKIENLRKGLARSKQSHGKSGGGYSGGPGRPATSVIEIYQIEVAQKIKQSWAFSERLAGDDTNLKVLLSIRIRPSGDIEEAKIKYSSGNGYFDQSALNAVRKANPVSPFPKEITAPYLEFDILGQSSEFM